MNVSIMKKLSANFSVGSSIKVAVFLLASLMLLSCDASHESSAGSHDDHHGGHHDEHDSHEEGVAKGLHGGRLLVSDESSSASFSLEIKLFETGLSPEFHVYAYENNQLVAPEKVDLNIQLNRLGNKKDSITFSPVQDYLRGNSVVAEPHSFEVIVQVLYKGQDYTWQYENMEGRTIIPNEMANEMQIKTDIAGPVVLKQTRTLTGMVQINPNRLSRIHPRFPGVVKKIHRRLGDTVKKGDVLATVQSNESLQNYNIKAPIGGVIIKRDLQLGEATSETPLFIIVDYSDVWVELDVFVRDLAEIKQGQSVKIETLDGRYQQMATIDWVSPLSSHASQSVRARLIVPNKNNQLRPGQFIRGHVTIAEEQVALAVRQSGVQNFRDFQVVFARFDDVYEVRMLTTGRSNKEWVEVLDGLDAGTNYVTHNSYIVKADIEKSGASHDH